MSQKTEKTKAMPRVMFKSALAGRSKGASTTCNEANAPRCGPKPTVPTPGRSPNQLETRMKINNVASNGNTLATMWRPTMPSTMS